MKKQTCTFFLFLLTAFCLFAQNTKLPDSKRYSEHAYIYKIAPTDLNKMYVKGKSFSDQMLGEKIGEYPNSSPTPKLSRGNYMVVRSLQNNLQLTDYTEDNFSFKVIPSEGFMLYLHDTLGNTIRDAVVKDGSKRLKFDPKLNAYIGGKVTKKKTLEINNRGVFHYIEVGPQEVYYKRGGYKPKWSFHRFWLKTKYRISNLFRKKEPQYEGFIVFSKPKYKPGETVKLKAYLHKGDKRYDKPLDLALKSNYRFDLDTTLIRLAPYRPGMFEYQFKLSDSIPMVLDNSYEIVLRKNKSDGSLLSASFRYEDYELKDIRFSATTDKKEISKDDTLKFNFKATDENDMARFGGKVDVVVTPQFYNETLTHADRTFIPDTLWSYTLLMGESSEKELVVPDSIFPKNVSFRFMVQCTYTSEDNQKRVENKYLYRKWTDYDIDCSLNNGTVKIQELYHGKSQATNAHLRVEGENSVLLEEKDVTLPYETILPWYVTDIYVKTPNGSYDETVREISSDKQINCRFYTENDSLYLRVENPANVPFWFNITKDKKEFFKGYADHNYAFTKKVGRKDAFRLQINYLYAASNKSLNEDVSSTEKNLSMQVSTPTTVYPGQTTQVHVSVTDKNGKPVKNADVTAYAVTNKFADNSMPYLPIYGKTRTARLIIPNNYEVDEPGFINMQTPLDWDKWNPKMTLDTIAFYRFLYPKTFYSYTEPTKDYTTLVSPFVVVDGNIEPIFAVWIDGRTTYVAQAQQQSTYVFAVKSGRHDFKFRTRDKIVTVSNIYIEAAKRNILSFNATEASWRQDNPIDRYRPYVMKAQTMDKKLKGNLSDAEVRQLSNDMITVENNFGYLMFPNTNQSVQLPGFIRSGNQFFYLNDTERNYYNRNIRGYSNSAILAGPFPERSVVNGESNVAAAFSDGRFLTYFPVEGGNQYTFYDRYQKIKSWDIPKLNITTALVPNNDFKDKLVSLQGIQENFNGKIHSFLSSHSGATQERTTDFLKTIKEKEGKLKLFLRKDLMGKPLNPSLIYVENKEANQLFQTDLYYGGTRNFYNLPEGNTTIYLIFRDSTVVSKTINIREGGQNYLEFDSVQYARNNAISEKTFEILNRLVYKYTVANPYTTSEYRTGKTNLAPESAEVEVKGSTVNGYVSGIVTDETGEPVIGAIVNIKGSNKGVVTNMNGRFSIVVPKSCELIVQFIGYERKTFKAVSGKEYKVTLSENRMALNEVVVGYGVSKKREIAGAVTTSMADELYNIPAVKIEAALQGFVSGVDINVRGTSTVDSNDSPLVIVDGLPYEGDYNKIDPNQIASVNVLKDAAATALYGTRGKNGVILIQTKNFKGKMEKTMSETGEDVPGNSIRRNFHDDAFWQPRLTTDTKGKASFEVTYPDDITTWNANFIAIGGKRMTDRRQLSIRSFKALTARLSVPRFAVRGDEFNVIGRISNYMGDSTSLSRTFTTNGKSIVNDLRINTNYIDKIPVRTTDGDSLSVSYSIRSSNGFVDGEERSLPIVEKGMLQTYGDFQVINDTLSHSLKADPNLGDVTVHAEASSFALFLDEIDKVEKYKYLCNEQMASKIKALLSKKRLYKLLGKEFNNEKTITELIGKLTKNKNTNKLWGWWNVDGTVFWVSRQVISALLDAEEAGYATNLNKENLIYYFKNELDRGMESLKSTYPYNLTFAKQEFFDRLLMLKRLNAPIDYEGYFKQINTLKDRSLNDKLKTFQVMASVGLQAQIPMDSLMKYSRKTLLGSLYWGMPKSRVFCFQVPYENNTEYTLMAYSIFKNMGGKEKELEQIRNYFFEMRNQGSWSNTFESTRIMEAILPDMLSENQSLKEVTLDVDGQRVHKFHYTEKIHATGKDIQIRKQGTSPVFITAYQQAWNPNPAVETEKGFAVKSYFAENKDSSLVLCEGKTATLTVSVDVIADAQYVQIEVPIPAGCSYESKPNSYWSANHAEYFKDKVVVFFKQMNKGVHLFNIKLNPRFTGKYTLNPAKAELMYFPTFYGNERIKNVEIE